MTPVKKWKKWMAVGCSHGELICPESRRAVLDFAKKFRPDFRAHLGDFIDLAAMRGGVASDVDSKDRARNIAQDVSEGISFLYEFSPNVIMLGNHEARLNRMAESPNAVHAHAAQTVLNELGDCAKKLKAKIYPYHNSKGVHRLGDLAMVHGFSCNVSAIRDHAETYGKVIMAHLHRVGIERGRRIDSPTGYCLGAICNLDMEYSSSRRASLAHSNGFAWGYFTDNSTTVNLCERQKNQPWLLP
jgi:hypothetical protein